ncbi:hypothetical protein LTR85_006901 [Meristemomyces frigidus]|nr:hypothetical protein LTR85_006901 [Meristemomyces frigidus]
MAAADIPASPLLELPGELRNRIYRLLLVEDDESLPITVVKERFEEPAILYACSEIRHEATPIYYCENRFCLEVTSFDPRLPLRWTRKLLAMWKRYNDEFDLLFVDTTVNMDMYPNWASLIGVDPRSQRWHNPALQE